MGLRARVSWLTFVLATSVFIVAGPVSAQAQPCTIVGTESNDVLVGTNQSDVICSLGGADQISGGSGDDVIFGGSGNDVLSGENGSDTIYGEAGSDQLNGGHGEDTLFGGEGNDSLIGGNGDDAITGEAGNDTIDGGPGDDDLLGEAGTDSATGGPGNDRCAAETVSTCEVVVPDSGGIAPTAVVVANLANGDLVFSDTSVVAAVSPSNAEGSVDLVVDGVVIGSTPIVSGLATFTWDTTQVGDGGRVLELRARSLVGALVASATITLDVANGLAASGRLEVDFVTGRLTAGEYVEMGVWSITLPDLLPVRYQGPAPADSEGDEDVVIDLFSHWPAVDEATATRIGEFLMAYLNLDDEGARAAAGNTMLGVAAAQAPTRFSVTENFEIAYKVASEDAANGVAEVDVRARVGPNVVACAAPCNGVPDYVDRVGAALEWSRLRYQTLGYDLPGGRTAVVIRAGRAKVFPTNIGGGLLPLWRTTIGLNNQGNEYSTARHEFFHVTQYQYAGILDFARKGVQAWLEATAQWATKQAERATDGDGPAQQYLSRLPEFAKTANWWPLAFQDQFQIRGATIPVPVPVNPADASFRHYGAFLLAEHLYESLDDSGTALDEAIRRSWELIDAGGNAVTAISDLIDERGGGLTVAEELVDFHLDNYVLEDNGNQGYQLDFLETQRWRARLETQLAGLRRFPAVGHTFASTGVWDPTTSERPWLVEGGAAYVEIGLPTDRAGRVAIQLPAIPFVTYNVLGFDGYPNPCPDFDLQSGPAPGTGGGMILNVASGCDLLVLVISNTNLDAPFLIANVAPGINGRGAQTDWHVAYEEQGIVNGEFETGDLTGWDIVQAGGSPPTIQVLSPGLGSTYAAYLAGAAGDGLEQTFVSPPGFREIQTFFRGDAGAQMAMELLVDGAFFARVEATSNGQTEEVLGIDTGDLQGRTVTIRLLIVNPVGIITLDGIGQGIGG